MFIFKVILFVCATSMAPQDCILDTARLVVVGPAFSDVKACAAFYRTPEALRLVSAQYLGRVPRDLTVYGPCVKYELDL